ncbi:MAG: hypothetical protein ABJA82_11960 [Myxococcales bacterium]
MSRCRCWNWNAVVLMASALGAALAGLALSGCGGGLDVGSDLLWTARHEVGDLSEWTALPGGGTEVVAPSAVEISSTQVHQGRFGAKLTITAGANDGQQTTALGRAGGLPREAYYSAWYYLPQAVAVRTFWVIMKFRIRNVPDNPGTVGELYDLDLYNLPGGEMSLRLYDHRTGMNPTLDVTDPIVPSERWFQVEAFYRNAQDSTGRLTYWLDGTKIVDIQGMAMAPNSWVGWQACSVGRDLVPATAVLYVDDAAISRTRVTPTGILAR